MSLDSVDGMDVPLTAPTSTNSTPTPTPPPTLRRDERRIRGSLWRRCTRHAHPHRGREASIIWDYGDSYIMPSKPSKPAHWICDHCDSVIAPQSNRSTANVRRHIQLKY